jgi:hypothetical protein
MNTTSSTVHGNEFPGNASRFLDHAQASSSGSHPEMSTVQTYDMTPQTRTAVYLTLWGGVAFLGIVAAYVWWGYYQWLRIV